MSLAHYWHSALDVSKIKSRPRPHSVRTRSQKRDFKRKQRTAPRPPGLEIDFQII